MYTTYLLYVDVRCFVSSASHPPSLLFELGMKHCNRKGNNAMEFVPPIALLQLSKGRSAAAASGIVTVARSFPG